MELLLPRSEIRRRMLATIGMSPNAAAVSATMDQINQFISEAYEETKSKRRWVRAVVTIRTQVGQDQTTIPFPTNVGPEGIVRMSFWDADADRYIPMLRRKIELIQRSDPLTAPITAPPLSQVADPATELTRQGRPVQYDPGKDGVINIWPPPDMPYEIMMEAYPNPEFVLDTDISVVDAMCIIYWASGCYFDVVQDTFLANKQQQKFMNRIREIHAWQSTGQSISIDAAADFQRSWSPGLLQYDYRTNAFPGQDV